MPHSLDLENDLALALDEEIAKEFMEQYNMTEEQMIRARQQQADSGLLLTTCLLNTHVIDLLKAGEIAREENGS